MLLNEGLVGRLREVGLTDALQHVLAEAKIDEINETSSSKARALALRHQGDIALERTTIADARGRFVAALQAIDALAEAGRSDDELLVERARTLERLGIGGGGWRADHRRRSLPGAVHPALGLTPQGQPTAPGRDGHADALMGLGRLQWRMGDAARAQDTHTRALRLALRVLTTSIERSAPLTTMSSSDRGARCRSTPTRRRTWRPKRMKAGPRICWHASLFACGRFHPSRAGRWPSRPPPTVGTSLDGTVSRTEGTGPSRLHRHRADDVVFAHPDRLLLDGTRQFDELIRWDPDNLRLRRESAAARLLGPEGSAHCAETPTCSITRERLEDALSVTLGAVGQFRQLAALDPENRSLTSDVAWGRTMQGRILYALGRHDEGRRCLDEALALYRSAAADPRDLQWQLDAPRVRRQKATLVAPADATQALAMLDASLAEFDKMPAESAAVMEERRRPAPRKSVS